MFVVFSDNPIIEVPATTVNPQRLAGRIMNLLVPNQPVVLGQLLTAVMEHKHGFHWPCDRSSSLAKGIDKLLRPIQASMNDIMKC
ncbi:hypothetical protein RRF57_000598 [Xylaria bambusicola]|uniref:Uncharacterized protein n=1 Tax=Xylaria bambusicola TaxID=326684 RepID=A0AAN7UCI7_9PEZI